MKPQKDLETLEKEIADVRYKLLLKGTQLELIKNSISKENFEEIGTLQKNVDELRVTLKKLYDDIIYYKFCYSISYEARFINIWTGQTEKEIYNETILLNHEIDIDFPSKNNWKLDNLDSDTAELFTDILKYLKNKYDEVILLKVKRIMC